jgi:protocatechuate 3,4-dioxygenase, alpha subunit
VSDLGPTPSQTVGPFFAIGLSDRKLDQVVPDGTADAIRIEGRVLDGAGEPVADAMVEVWQADAAGEYSGDFGWGRSGTDDEGRFGFLTVKPGPAARQAPHLVVLVFARGLLKPVLTRMYFPDEAEANARDPVLETVPAEERSTLVAAADGDVLRFDLRLQGDDQTAFFDL